MRLLNQTVLVTGGASGLGGATAEMIVAAGGRVVIADVNETAGRTAAARLGASARFVRITNAGLAESHVHDVIITREAPNYNR